MKTEKQQAMEAAEFARRWEGRGYEKGDSQVFWTELLTEVYGIDNPSTFIKFEQQAQLDHTSFIDVMIPSTKVMIEQKSLGKDLRTPIKQSDGSMLNPFQQAQRYMMALPVSQHPRWIVTCNFAEFDVYDMENPKGEPQRIFLKDLGREYYRLQFLVETGNEHLQKELEVSMKAGAIVGKLYDAFIREYGDDDPYALRNLNILCVRLVFCLYAEDAGIFGRHDIFHDYMEHYPTEDMRAALLRLFEVLNTPIEKRSRYLKADLAAFPYTNGGLFAEEIDIPQFTDEIRDLLLRHASLDFDWSMISPTIFGGVFESTLNPVTRRSGGMHYTSIENIHKVIDPLFLDNYRRELQDIKEEKVTKTRNRRLADFQQRLASLRFFDPACGSGNFLTETYISLRRMENEVIKELYSSRNLDLFDNPIKVSINQFYGIEINDFAVTVATTALWISEAQMLTETERIISQDIDFLPLKSYANIHEGNSLAMDWQSVITGGVGTGGVGVSPAQSAAMTGGVGVSPAPCAQGNITTAYEKFAMRRGAGETPTPPAPTPPAQGNLYIIGNPPFVGARLMSEAQKEDVLRIFGKNWKNVGNLDYVCCWYKKAADMMRGTRIRAALVSTNSVSQGEQVANLWAPLMADGLKINFAHRTFRWDSEAQLKAHVHCVIIGFSYEDTKTKTLFDGEQPKLVSHINPYLVEAPDTFIYSRSKPLADVPQIGIGNKPIDGGNYLFEKEEMEEFIRQEPLSAQYFHPWYGSVEFIHQRPRYCLWLGNCTPSELRRMPHCMKRVENVRQLRLESKSEGTRKLADRPTRFHVENMPEDSSIIVPKVSSERRKYVPMGFIDKGTFASDLVFLIPNATLYHFGILESNVHMAWMRAVCGRLEMRYRYSKDIVYNNFPWPSEGVATGGVGVSPAPRLQGNLNPTYEKYAMRIGAGETPTPPAPAPPALPAEIKDFHYRKYLPHLENHGLQVLTFRLFDSVPKDVIAQWKQLLEDDASLETNAKKEHMKQLIDQYEDAGFGQCFLKEERVANIVKTALEHFDGKRYDLVRWCIMPNHVHVLINVYQGCSLSDIMHTWRSYTAHEANKVLDRKGDFWMTEYFDRYIRDERHLKNAIDYIDNNPVKAGLADTPSAWSWCSAAGDIGGVATGGVGTGGVGVSPAPRLQGNITTAYEKYAMRTGAGETPTPPEATTQKSPIVAQIERTAQAILDARAKYPDSSLADLYDPVLMPPELRKAHQDNDRAVMQAYGFSLKMTESDCVAALFKMYAEQTEK